MIEDNDRELGEHESRRIKNENETHKEELNQSPEEKKLIKRVEKIFARNKKYREKFDSKWMDYYKMFRGNQWKEERPPYRHSEVINFIFSAIQSTVPIMTDSRPKFEFLPVDPTDIRFAEIVNMVSEYDWTRHNWLMPLVETLYDANIFGSGLAGMTWDGELDYGLGGIRFKACDPFHFYPSPRIRNIQDDRDFIYAYPMLVSDIKRLWPSKGKYIKPDINASKNDRTDITRPNYTGHEESGLIYENEGQGRNYDLDEALVIHYHSRDDEIESTEKAPDGVTNEEQQPVYQNKKKYPFGRWTVICNKVLLQDGHNPYEDAKIPFAKVDNYVLPHEFWGESEVAQMESPQRTFNKMVSFALDILTLMGNPIFVMDTDSGVDPDTLYNEPGQVVIKNPKSEFRREEGVQLQPFVLQLIDRMKSWIDTISGQSDMTKGVTAPNLSGVAIEQITEAAQTRIRQKSRNLDAMLQDFGQMYISRIQQFYTVPRMMRITNNQNVEEYFKVQFLEDENGSKQIKYTPYSTDVETGEVRAGEEELVPISGLLDVRVVTGTLLPFNKAVKENKLINMFTAGIIDREEVLKGMDHPNWEALLQRMEEKEAQMAQAQASQASA